MPASASADPPLLSTPNPEKREQTDLSKFRRSINRKHNLSLETYEELHTWSVTAVEDYWRAWWDFMGIRYARKFDEVLRPSTRPDGSPLKAVDMVNRLAFLFFSQLTRMSTASTVFISRPGSPAHSSIMRKMPCSPFMLATRPHASLVPLARGRRLQRRRSSRCPKAADCLLPPVRSLRDRSAGDNCGIKSPVLPQHFAPKESSHRIGSRTSQPTTFRR